MPEEDGGFFRVKRVCGKIAKASVTPSAGSSFGFLVKWSGYKKKELNSEGELPRHPGRHNFADKFGKENCKNDIKGCLKKQMKGFMWKFFRLKAGLKAFPRTPTGNYPGGGSPALEVCSQGLFGFRIRVINSYSTMKNVIFGKPIPSKKDEISK